jgi:hypothetical protein
MNWELEILCMVKNSCSSMINQNQNNPIAIEYRRNKNA